MRALVRLLACFAAVAWLAGCLAGAPSPALDEGPASQTVYVTSNGWHTAIVVPGPALRESALLPEAADFPAAAYIAFGWGDRVYYPAEDPDLAVTLAAALTPTPAVMHLAARGGPPMEVPGGEEVVTLAMTEAAFRALVRAMAGEFTRPDGKRAPPISQGLTPESHFYEAEGRFHLFNTCNTWTARMLRAGGVRLSPTGVVTADELMDRLRAALEAQ